jgi:hypothetical protein
MNRRDRKKWRCLSWSESRRGQNFAPVPALAIIAHLYALQGLPLVPRYCCKTLALALGAQF